MIQSKPVANNEPVSVTASVPGSLTVADVLLHYFSLEGVSHVFGIPGGGLANLLTAFKNARSSIPYIICRQETGAAYIADGYYRTTGKLGVVMVTSGPGATNALTGVMNAMNDGSALLLITGEVNESYFGMGYLQEGIDSNLDIDDIFKSATGYSTMILDASNFEVLIKQALRNALSLPRKAVHISIPNNVPVESVASKQLPSSVTSYRAMPSGVKIEEVEKAVRALTAAMRPLIFVGNGCRNVSADAIASLVKFAEYYAIPVMTTADGKGIFPESHPMSLRAYGIAGCTWPYYWMHSGNDNTAPYDGLLVLGSSLGELATNKWLPLLLPHDGPFIQVDINQSIIGRAFPVTQGIVGEADAFIRDMGMLIDKIPADETMVRSRTEWLSAIKVNHAPFDNEDQYNSIEGPIEPAAVMKALQEKLPKEKSTKIFLDAGNCVGWGIHYLTIDAPWSIFSSLSMGPMGFAVGAVIGAKLGCPEATCIGIVGDGAFLMHGSEVSTARQYGVGAIWVVLFDNNLSMVSQGQGFFFPDKEDPGIWEQLYELGNPDLVKFAEALGAQAYRVDKYSDFDTVLPMALKGAEAGQPQVVVVNINVNSVPPYYSKLYL